MAKRPKPTKPLIMDITGGNSHLLECIHHGLSETNLSELYKVLDLKELLAFAGGSWKKRSEEKVSYRAKDTKLYDIHKNIYQRSMPWLNKNISISEKQRTKYEKTNPFNGKDLKSRLDNIDNRTVEKMKQSLSNPVHKYVFECNYRREKRKLSTNHNLHLMGFQNAYPKKGRIGPAYAKEIARMLKSYPKTYIDIKDSKSNKEQEPQNTKKQIELF